MGSRVVTLRLPDEKIVRLKQYAARERKTLTSVLEEALDAVLDTADQRPTSNLDRLAYMIGSVKGTPRSDVTKMSMGDVLQERYDRDGHL